MGNQARVADNATVVSTSTRNFPNRLGNGANVFLGSAELAAVTAKLGRLPKVEDFTNHYSIINRLQPVVPVFVDNRKWLVLRDKIFVEDTAFLFGKGARIYIEGLDHNNEYVKKNIDVRISHDKSEKIKRINKHNFYSLDLVKVSNKYHLLINYVNSNL